MATVGKLLMALHCDGGEPGRNRPRQGEAEGRSRVADDFRVNQFEGEVRELPFDSTGDGLP